MAWKPKLPVVGTNVVPMERRLWVAIAEKNAEHCVNLFVNVMKSKKYPIKIRMEAATRIVAIAGATFRGEKLDGNGRPAANLPAGATQGRLNHDALRMALRQLPPGSVLEAPEEAVEGEMYVVLADGEHNRKPTGQMAQTTIGSLGLGEADPETAKAIVEKRLAKQAEEELKKKPPAIDDAVEMIGAVFSHGRRSA